MKTITLWSLYERPRNSGKRWARVSPHSYTKQVAITVFQDRLIAGAFDVSKEFRLRRVFLVDNRASV